MSPALTPSETRRARILEAAIACFAREGFHLTSMVDIVAASGCAPGTIYREFRSKEDLILAVVDQAMRDLRGSLASNGHDCGRTYPVILAIMSVAEGLRDERVRSCVEEYMEAIRDDLEDADATLPISSGGWSRRRFPAPAGAVMETLCQSPH